MKRLFDGKTIYITLVLAVCYGLGIIALFTVSDTGNLAYEVLQKGFTAFPVLAALCARWITKDKTPWKFSLNVWKQPKLWMFSAVVPGVLIALGASLYFMLFPEQYSGVFDYGILMGMSNGGKMQITSLPVFWLVTVLLAAFFIPLQILKLGEEIGWREYLLPRQIKRYGVQKAVLLNSFLWGIAHLPLIYFGFNYSENNAFAPWSNMIMMMLVCMTFGIICSYVTIVSGNCMYAAIVHGVVNLIGEVPVFLSLEKENGLLGPNPTGLVGMLFLIICAVIMFVRLGKIENKLEVKKGLNKI